MTDRSNWCNKKPVPPKDPCRTVGISSLCEMGWQPLLITGLFTDMLRRHFAEKSEIESDDLSQYVWTEDERTGILIESVYRWRGDVVEKRPAVLVKRNAMQGVSLMLNDLAGTDEKGFEYEEYTRLWVGSHTLFCIHGTGASVEILQTEVTRHLDRFAPIVRRYLGLAKCQVTERGGISEVEEAKEHFTVPVTIGWAYQENWKVQMEALPLRRIPFSTLVNWYRLDNGIP